MQVDELLNEGLKRSYRITLSAGDLGDEIDKRLTKVQPTIEVRGFRKGKVPLEVLRKRFSEAILPEVIEETFEEGLQDHFKNMNDRMAGTPRVEMREYGEWKWGEDFFLDVSYDVMPDLSGVDFSGISLEKPVVKDVEGEVDDMLREMSHSLVEKEGASAEGDEVVVDFTGRVDGEPFEDGEAEDFPLKIGAGTFLPGFDDRLVGLSAGEVKEVEVSVPESHSNEIIAGRTVAFTVKVKSVHTPVRVEIDDELANRHGAGNLDDLRNNIRGDLMAEYTRDTRNLMKRKLIEALGDSIASEMPRALVETELRRVAGGFSGPDLDGGGDPPEVEATDEQWKQAENLVKYGLLISELADKNGISVTEAEVERVVLEHYGSGEEGTDNPSEALRGNENLFENLKSLALEVKVLDHIFELVNVEEKEIGWREFAELIDE